VLRDKKLAWGDTPIGRPRPDSRGIISKVRARVETNPSPCRFALYFDDFQIKCAESARSGGLTFYNGELDVKRKEERSTRWDVKGAAGVHRRPLTCLSRDNEIWGKDQTWALPMSDLLDWNIGSCEEIKADGIADSTNHLFGLSDHDLYYELLVKRRQGAQSESRWM
jgi:hypothetical protein